MKKQKESIKNSADYLEHNPGGFSVILVFSLAVLFQGEKSACVRLVFQIELRVRKYQIKLLNMKFSLVCLWDCQCLWTIPVVICIPVSSTQRHEQYIVQVWNPMDHFGPGSFICFDSFQIFLFTFFNSQEPSIYPELILYAIVLQMLIKKSSASGVF